MVEIVLQLPVHAVRSGFGLLREPQFYWPAMVLMAGLVSRWWTKFQLRIKQRGVRHWPAHSAVVDVVSVVERVVSEKHDYRVYVATLTYFYRDPGLEMGEFEREFKTKPEARHWVEQFKGRSVLVHVNPADATDSMLLEGDLAGLETHRPVMAEAAGMDALPDDGPEALSPGYRLLCGIAELRNWWDWRGWRPAR